MLQQELWQNGYLVCTDRVSYQFLLLLDAIAIGIWKIKTDTETALNISSHIWIEERFIHITKQVFHKLASTNMSIQFEYSIRLIQFNTCITKIHKSFAPSLDTF